MLYCLIWLPLSFTDLNVLDSVIKHFSSTEEELPFLQVTVKFYWYSKSLGLLFLFDNARNFIATFYCTLAIILQGDLIRLLTMQLLLAGSSKMMLSGRFSVCFTSYSPVTSNIVPMYNQLLGYIAHLHSIVPTMHYY